MKFVRKIGFAMEPCSVTESFEAPSIPEAKALCRAAFNKHSAPNKDQIVTVHLFHQTSLGARGVEIGKLTGHGHKKPDWKKPKVRDEEA